MSFETGKKFGHYEIRQKIGVGGMGEVYLAEDTRLRRKVAIKVLPADITGNRERLQRFEQEAFAASALNHPHILTIHEFGKSKEGTHFIVMEYVEGITLNEQRANSGMSVSEILDVAVQVASALSAAHEAGIVHRDIKPENIMLRQDGYVKILDFGLAKLTEKNKVADSDAEAQTRVLVNTNPGAIMGTAAYMSPEQARGLNVDARTDIWSLGVVLYEILSGHKPFTGATPTDVIVAVVNKEPPPISSYAPDVPSELTWIVGKALHKEADARYQTAKEFLADLRRLKQRIEFENELKRSTTPEAHSTKDVKAVPTLIHPQVTAEASTKSTQSERHSVSSAEYIASEIKKHKPTSIAALMVLLLAIGGLGFWYFGNRSSNLAQIESIAVLPFVNESGNTDAEYLSDGMTETLISSLSQLPKLYVKARGSVFRYKGKEADAQTIGKELNVQAILNGRVVQRGQDLTLYIELIDANTENVLWKENYNRPMANLLALQSEIARDVSQKLRQRLTGAEVQNVTNSYTENVEAYQLYLKGRYHAFKLTPAEIEKGIGFYRQAIEIDPTYALAYAGMADAYRTLPITSDVPPKDAFPKAKAAAHKALQIDDRLAEAHIVLGWVGFWFDWDWSAAESELKKAIELSPNNSDAHRAYAHLLSDLGRHEEAVAEGRRARELDPLTLVTNRLEAQFLFYAGRETEAIDRLQKTLELDPNFWTIHLGLAQIYIHQKRYDEALAALGKARELGGNTLVTALTGYALAMSGRRTEAQTALNELKRLSTQKYVPSHNIAMIYSGLNEKDETFVWLERAYEERGVHLSYLKVDPLWDKSRSDPRFQDLLRRVGFPQ